MDQVMDLLTILSGKINIVGFGLSGSIDGSNYTVRYNE